MQVIADPAATPTMLQWAMTAVFYSGVHCMIAYFSPYNVSHQSHSARETAMADPQFQIPGTAYFVYLRLRKWSEGSRYLLQQPTAAMVRKALEDYLAPIADFVKLDQ